MVIHKITLEMLTLPRFKIAEEMSVFSFPLIHNHNKLGIVGCLTPHIGYLTKNIERSVSSGCAIKGSVEDELCGDGRGRFAGDEKGKDQAKDKAEEGDF